MHASDPILILQADGRNRFDNTNCAESGVNKKTKGRAEEEETSTSATDDVKVSTEGSFQKNERNSSQKVDGQGHKGNLWILRIVKLAAISFVVLCTIIGATLNKVTLVSITGRMYNLSNSTNLSLNEKRHGLIYFIELVIIMAIPDIVGFFRCLIWGVIGKTAETHPWPSWKSIVMVSVQLVAKLLIFYSM